MAFQIKLAAHSSKKQLWLMSVVLTLIIFLLYGNSIPNDYSVDDFYVTYENPRVEKGIAGIPEIFTSHHVVDQRASFGYRPLVLTTFAMEKEIFGFDPHVSHFVNILLYLIVCILLFRILQLLLQKYNIFLSALAVFIFAMHPVHTEVINNIKSRDELLCLIGALIAFIYAIRFHDTGNYKYIFLALLGIVIGLMSKLSIIVFFAIIPLALYFFRNGNTKKILTVGGAIILIFFIGWAVKVSLLGTNVARNYGFTENPLFFEESFLARIPAGLYVLGFYLRLLIFPHPLSFYYGYNAIPIAGWDNIWVWVSFAVHAAMFVYALINLPKKTVLSFAIFFYLIAISMVANIAVPVVGIVADRFLFIPSIGFALALAYLALKVFKLPVNDPEYNVKLPTGFMAIAVVVLLLYSGKIVTRNMDWRNEISLFMADVESYPESAKIQNMIAIKSYELATEASDQQRQMQLIGSSIQHYQYALNIYPYSSLNWAMLGRLYHLHLNDIAKAKGHYDKAIELDDDLVEAYYGRGYLFEMAGDRKKAMQDYQKAITLTPPSYNAFSRLGYLLYAENKLDYALMVYEKGIEAFPDHPDFYVNIGNIHLDSGNPGEALPYYEEAYQMNDQDAQLLADMSKAYKAVGNQSKAKEFEAKSNAIR